jgi:RNA polymerase sigma factor (sigma-70 family)
MGDLNFIDAGSALVLDSAQPQPASPAWAMSELFREHNRALVSFLMTRVHDEDEAKEIAQEAYVRLLQLHQPVAAGFLRWYLFKIAKDLAVDRHRQRTTRDRIDSSRVLADFDSASPTECSVMASDELAVLRAALGELPPKCQRAFLLHRFEDLSTAEVGERMGLTDRMVRKYVRRALVYCRLRLAGVPRDEIGQVEA